MSDVLKLGCFDAGRAPAQWRDWLRRWHGAAMPDAGRFRGEANGEWRAPAELPGEQVAALQQRLRAAGFMPHGDIDGIFGYLTQSAARLFQEYVRAVEGHADIGTPDGVVGDRTRAHLERWARDGLRPYWEAHAAAPSEDYLRWMRSLERFRDVNEAEPTSRSLQLAQAYPQECDTCRIATWAFDPAAIHLVGIRRAEWKRTEVRDNDDVFVLLVNGTAFKFMGSTDPSARMAQRSDEPFLVPGQHRYRFGWHKLSAPEHAFRALRPAGAGVLVCRDSNADDALTDADYSAGLERNDTINIHWSGGGATNWSAGCQVIAGRRYVDGAGRDIDCRAFAAQGYADLATKTRAAYNVLIDLLTVMAPRPLPADGTLVRYFLIREEDLEMDLAALESALLTA